jgi:hypothetical protein
VLGFGADQRRPTRRAASRDSPERTVLGDLLLQVLEPNGNDLVPQFEVPEYDAGSQQGKPSALVEGERGDRREVISGDGADAGQARAVRSPAPLRVSERVERLELVASEFRGVLGVVAERRPAGPALRMCLRLLPLWPGHPAAKRDLSRQAPPGSGRVIVIQASEGHEPGLSARGNTVDRRVSPLGADGPLEERPDVRCEEVAHVLAFDERRVSDGARIRVNELR